MPQRKQPQFRLSEVKQFISDVFNDDIHSKRILSLSNATAGVLESGSLAISAIGLGLANINGTATKHAVKQVDRLIGNVGIDVWDYFGYWVPYVISQRREIVVAMDWTDFDSDGHATIALNLLTGHGRAIPLLWRTVKKSELKDQRNVYEDSLLIRLKEVVPEGVLVTVIADRGFMDTNLMEIMRDTWGFGYVIRLRGNVIVTSKQGEKRTAAQWVGKGGRAKTLRDAKLTAKRFLAPTIVCTQAKGMKESWCLVASDGVVSASQLVKYYAKRWSIETYFRDTKDIRFGLGMSNIHTKSTQRRDRLFLLSAFAIVLLTLLGAACEKVGYDRTLKANTVKHRTHSLFRQGQMVYSGIPNMREEWLSKIMNAFVELTLEHKSLSKVFYVV